jgi:hypothetical protein
MSSMSAVTAALPAKGKLTLSILWRMPATTISILCFAATNALGCRGVGNNGLILVGRPTGSAGSKGLTFASYVSQGNTRTNSQIEGS